jgi:hypothetical protein
VTGNSLASRTAYISYDSTHRLQLIGSRNEIRNC